MTSENETAPTVAAARKIEAMRSDAHHLLVGGATLGTFAIVTGAIFGATCPMCIVAAPVMLGAGAIQRWRCSRAERAAASADGRA